MAEIKASCDHGAWNPHLRRLAGPTRNSAEAAEPGVTVRMYRYGFFSSPAFLIPLVRCLAGSTVPAVFPRRKFARRRRTPGSTRSHTASGTFVTASGPQALPEGERSIQLFSRAASSTRRSRGTNTSSQGRCSASLTNAAPTIRCSSLPGHRTLDGYGRAYWLSRDGWRRVRATGITTNGGMAGTSTINTFHG